MIQVELHDQKNNLVKVLPGATKAAYYAILNQDGSASFLIHRADPDAQQFNILQGGIDRWIVHLKRRGPLALPGDDFIDRFAFVVEQVTYGLDDREEESGWITVAGRGTLSLLEGRMVFPPGYDGITQSTMTAQWQTYAATGAGSVMSGEIDRSNPRFALALTHSIIQATNPVSVQLRFDDLRKYHDYLVANGPMDAQMVGTDYQSFNQLGTDRSAGVIIQLGPQDSLRGFTVERDTSQLYNYIAAQGQAEGINALLRSASDSGSITGLGRREGFASDRNDNIAAQIAQVAAQTVSALKATDVRITCYFTDSLHTQLYRDFFLGDYVMFNVVLLSWLQKYRVVGIQVADIDAEIEEVNLDLNSIRQEYLLKLNKKQVATQVGLSVVSQYPQGAPFNDSAAYYDNCSPSFPFHFARFIPSNVLQLNYAKLSFFLYAFRAYVSAVNNAAVTSAAGTSHTHTTPAHAHLLATFQGAIVSGTNNAYQFGTSGSTQKFNLLGDTGADIYTQTTSGGATSGADAAHTHQVTSNVSLVYGIFESTVATGVTVKINGTDRTAALGGGSGFTSNQQELEISQYLTIGQVNTIDLTPTNLGRILGDIRITGYIQSN